MEWQTTQNSSNTKFGKQSFTKYVINSPIPQSINGYVLGLKQLRTYVVGVGQATLELLIEEAVG